MKREFKAPGSSVVVMRTFDVPKSHDFHAILQPFCNSFDFSPASEKKDHGMEPMGLEFGASIKRQRMSPMCDRVMLYVRQENEDIYTPLHVVPPTTTGLLNAVRPEHRFR